MLQEDEMRGKDTLIEIARRCLFFCLYFSDNLSVTDKKTR